MTTTTHPAVAEYVARIQAALADLPAAEVEEIVDDIGQHLAEVAGELGEEVSVETLTGRLGTPEQYASELRAAAEYPPAKPVAPKRGRLVPRIALWSVILGSLLAFGTGLAGTPRMGGEPLGGFVLFGPLVALALVLIFTGGTTVAEVADLPESRAFVRAGRRMVAALPDNVAGYLRSLRPAWWLLRVVLLLGALLLVVLRARVYGDFAVLPLLMLVVLLWFGKRARDDARWRWMVTPANVFTVGLGIALLGSAAWPVAGSGYSNVVTYLPSSGLWDEGRELTNVYVFGPDGKPLPDAYLYDQDGRPITLWFRRCDGVDYQPINKFPLPKIEYDSNGCHETTEVPFTVAVPKTPTK